MAGQNTLTRHKRALYYLVLMILRKYFKKYAFENVIDSKIRVLLMQLFRVKQCFFAAQVNGFTVVLVLQCVPYVNGIIIAAAEYKSAAQRQTA